MIKHRCFPVNISKFLRIARWFPCSNNWVICFASKSFPNAKFITFITFESCDKKYLKQEKIWQRQSNEWKNSEVVVQRCSVNNRSLKILQNYRKEFNWTVSQIQIWWRQSKIQNKFLKIIFVPHIQEWIMQWKYYVLGQSSFLFSRCRLLSFLNFMEGRPNLTRATLIQVWLWYSRWNICKITGKSNLKICNFFFCE